MIMLGLLTCTAVNGADSTDSIKIKINDEVFDVKLENNSATRELVKTLEKENVTVNASEYGGFEKVGDLGFSLPTSDENINTSPGDLVLYQGNQISLFYDSHSWSYTKLGKIDDVDSNHLKEVLGSGDVTIVLSLK
nr:cyclophilin-like fold protein [Methanobrevibacter sp.]